MIVPAATALLEDAPAFDPLAIARSLRPLLAGHAEECERQSRVPEAVMHGLRVSGLFKMMFPKRAGGPGVQLITHLETIAELAKGCTSTAWSFGLLSGVTGAMAGLPPPAPALIFKTGEELCCSAVSLTGKAKRVGEGYVVSGSWGYASGCLHAAWAWNGICVLDDDGNVTDSGFGLIADRLRLATHPPCRPLSR
jgi:alkylation response protein AidB-like acyl-CoA dehydrogenase